VKAGVRGCRVLPSILLINSYENLEGKDRRRHFSKGNSASIEELKLRDTFLSIQNGEQHPRGFAQTKNGGIWKEREG